MTTSALRAATALATGVAVTASPLAEIAAVAADAGDRDVIVVTGRTLEETLPQELARYGADVVTISSLELREALLTDVSQAIQMQTPGVFIAPRGGPFSYIDISLQGSRTQDMLFLVDGVRINNRLYPGTITDTLPTSMVERVEVLKGGQSLFYGTNAAAGVINVVTRGYTDELDGLVTVGADTNDSYRADGYVRGAAGPGNFVAYASYDTSEGFRMYDNVQPSATDQNRGYDVATYGVKYRWEILDNLSLDARYQHNDADLDYLRYNQTVSSENSRDEEIASLSLNYEATEDLEFQIKGYWHDWDTRYSDIRNDRTQSPPFGAPTVVSDNLYWGFEDKGVNALAKYTPGGPVEFIGGYDFQQYSALDDVWRIEPVEEEVHAVFGQVRTSEDFIENGALALGVRYNDTGGATSTVWNLSGRYDFSSSLYVQGVVGTSFLLPNAEQLYVIEEFWYLGNPDVEPEEAENVNVSIGGLVGADDRFSWQATYFARNITNMIDGVSFADAGIDTTEPYRGLDISGTDPDGPFYDGVFFNVPGEVETRGFELFGTAQLTDDLSVVASYTHSETEAPSGDVFPRIPEDLVKVGARYDAGQWGAGADVLWVGEQLSSAGAFGTVDYGDYAVVDLNAHVFLDRNQQHKLTARLANALDEEYATRVAGGVADVTGGDILVSNRGMPQTLHVSYSYAF